MEFGRQQLWLHWYQHFMRMRWKSVVDLCHFWKITLSEVCFLFMSGYKSNTTREGVTLLHVCVCRWLFTLQGLSFLLLWSLNLYTFMYFHPVFEAFSPDSALLVFSVFFRLFRFPSGQLPSLGPWTWLNWSVLWIRSHQFDFHQEPIVCLVLI